MMEAPLKEEKGGPPLLRTTLPVVETPSPAMAHAWMLLEDDQIQCLQVILQLKEISQLRAEKEEEPMC